MRSVLYILRKPPSVRANELIDMMLVSGVFEQPARALFMDDGAWQLNVRQDASAIGRKDTARALGALNAYGVRALFVHEPSLAERGIVTADLAVPARLVDDDGVRDLLRQADAVVTD